MRDSYYDVIHAASTPQKQCIGWAEKPVCTNMVPKVGNRERCTDCRLANDKHRKKKYDQGRPPRRSRGGKHGW